MYNEGSSRDIKDCNNYDCISVYKMLSPCMHTIVFLGGAHGVIVIAVEKRYGDSSSNPGQGCLHFT